MSLNAHEIEVLKYTVQRLTDLQTGMTGVKDNTGFSNADLAVGKALCAAWSQLVVSDADIAGVGQLLTQYHGQISTVELAVARKARALLADVTAEGNHAARAHIGATTGKWRDEEALVAKQATAAAKAIEAKAVTATWTGKTANVTFGYDADIVSLLKDTFPIATRRWDAQASCWRVTGAALGFWQAFEKALVQRSRTLIVVGQPVYGTAVADTNAKFRLDCSLVNNGKDVKVVFDYGTPVFWGLKDAVKDNQGRFNKRETDSYWTIPAEAIGRLADAVSRMPDVDQNSLESLLVQVAGSQMTAAQKTKDVQVHWPTHVKPYGHQDAGAKFLAGRDTCLLADDMGLGKTLQALIAAESIRPAGAQVLVVCPASLTYNWLKEIRQWIPGVTARVLSSDNLNVEATYTLVSYDTAKPRGFAKDPDFSTPAKRAGTLKANAAQIDKPINAVFKALLGKKWWLAVCDEAHRLKNTKSQRHQLIAALLIDLIWQLTGTPVMNRPIDLFGMLKLGRHPLGRSRHDFGLRYCNAVNNGYGWDYTGASNQAELAEKLSSWMLRREKDKVLDLPGKLRVEQTIAVPRAIATIDFATIGEMMSARRKLAVAKADATWERIEDILESGEKVIVFSEYLDVLDRFSQKCVDASVGFARIDGSVSGQKRQDAVTAFQTKADVRVFIGQTLASGEGITLTAATQVIFNDLSLVPAYHWQAEDRAYRIGQKSRVTVCYMLSNADLDTALWEMLKGKIAVVKTLEGGLQDANQAAEQGAKALFSALKRLMSHDKPAAHMPSQTSIPSLGRAPGAVKC